MEKAIVLHVDILGFKEMITLEENADNSHTLQLIQETIRIIKDEIAKKGEWLRGTSYPPLEFKTFSDNLYVSARYDDTNQEQFVGAFYRILEIARTYQRFLLMSDALCRGGISFGQDHISEHIIYSQALVKAYTIETETAIYPRIVIDEELIKRIELIHPTLSDNLLYNIIIKDWAGIYFVNLLVDLTEMDRLKTHQRDFFENFITSEHEKFIARLHFKLSTVRNASIKQKYQWLIQLLRWLKKDHTLLQFEYCNFHTNNKPQNF